MANVTSVNVNVLGKLSLL